MPRIDDEYDSMMNMMPTESSSESNLRANAAAKGSALAKESYSEQRLRKNAKPMVKAKAKAKPVVGRAGAQTPGARAKLAPRGTPMRPTKPVGDRGMDARLAAKKAANRGTPMRPVTKKASTTGGRPTVKKATNPAAKAVINILSGKGLRANNGMNAAQVAAENKRRAAAAAKRGK